MKNILPFFLLCALQLVFMQCQKDTVAPNPQTPVEFSCVTAPSACEITAANGNFAIAALQELHASELPTQNIFFSPFSISTALSMTLNGANGETFTAMQTALRTNNFSLAAINEAYQLLLEVLPNLDPTTRIKLANSIWPQVNYPVLTNFLDANRAFYNSEVFPTNFNDSEAAIAAVNDWVANATDGLIQNTLSELPAGVVMLLINAIYFKGSWQTEFDPALTFNSSFQTINGAVDADFMNLREIDLPYFENDIFQAVDLPYGDSIFSMSVFVPKAGHQVDELITMLDGDVWNDWVSSFAPTNINLYLPKFKLEYEVKLKPVLSLLGMGNAFSDRADFSNMIDGGGVKIDDVIHKAFIEVNEEGTEAAAVTVVVIIETSIPIIPTVQADHPFLFVIRDNKTNSILFMGKLMTPIN